MNVIKKIGAAIALSTMMIASAFADNKKDQMFDPTVQLGEFCTGQIIHSEREKVSGEVETFVLTAKHCVDKADQRLQIRTFVHDKKLRSTSTVSYDAKVLGKSYKSDLALIRINDKQTIFENVVTIAPKETVLEFGQPVHVVGYPKNLSLTWTEGRLGFVEALEHFSPLSTTTEFLRATPDVAPGSSGGGLYRENGSNYELIGTTTGGWPRWTWLNYFTPLEEIHEYLDVAKKSWKTAPKVEEKPKPFDCSAPAGLSCPLVETKTGPQ